MPEPATGPGDGSGPVPPFGPTSSRLAAESIAVVYWAVGPFPCLTPRWLPPAQATAAVGPGTRTALAHCAALRPKPARCVAERKSVAGVLSVDGPYPCAVRRRSVNRPLTCTVPQRRRWSGVARTDQFPLTSKGFGVSARHAIRHRPNGPLTSGAVVRVNHPRARRRCRWRSPRPAAGPGRRPPSRSLRPAAVAAADDPGVEGQLRGCGCRPGSRSRRPRRRRRPGPARGTARRSTTRTGPRRRRCGCTPRSRRHRRAPARRRRRRGRRRSARASTGRSDGG